MPVIYLVNVPKNNLVFSLHVFRYAFGVHCSHVTLQGNDKAANATSQLQKHTYMPGCYDTLQKSHIS